MVSFWFKRECADAKHSVIHCTYFGYLKTTIKSCTLGSFLAKQTILQGASSFPVPEAATSLQQ